MALEKQSLNNFLPDGFETEDKDGYKTNFSDDKISTGFQKDVADILSGPNLNNLIDVIGKNTNTLNNYVEYLNSLSVNKTPIIDSNNRLNSTQIGLKVYSATETYLLNDLVTTIQDGKVLFYKSLVASNTGHDLTDEQYWQEVKLGGGGGLELCDIGTALYVDETKGLRRYLNGQIVDINTNTQAFLNRLLQIQATNPEYFTDEATWQSEATLNADGCVYKFVLNYDSTGTNVVSVRLPKYPDYVEVSANGTIKQIPVKTNQTNFGDNAGALAVPANNTNITYYVKSRDGSGNVFVNNETGSSVRWYADLTGVELNSRTKLKMRYFIQIATGSETENNIINEIELNNPYSLFDSKYSDHELNNLSWLKSEGQWNSKAVYPTAYDKLLKVYNGTETVEGLSVKLLTETYTDYDFVLNTAEETFRLPLKTLHTDDTVDSLSLYFYVGETVQNANLIDAGRIGEQLATKTDMLQASGAGMPSDKYIDLTLAESGSTYTAPANGYFSVGGNFGNVNGSFTLALLDNAMGTPLLSSEAKANGGDYGCFCCIPAKKGDKVFAYYNYSPFSNTASGTPFFRFVYAEGES